MPGAPRSNGKTFFWCSPVFDRKILQKSQGAKGPTRCKSGQAITWFVGVTIYCTFFNNNSPRQFLCKKILLKKKIATVRGTLIEQNFELRGAGTLGRICTPITGCFHDKSIISKENIRLDCYLLPNYYRRQCTLLSPT